MSTVPLQYPEKLGSLTGAYIKRTNCELLISDKKIPIDIFLETKQEQIKF